MEETLPAIVNVSDDKALEASTVGVIEVLSSVFVKEESVPMLADDSGV